MLKWAFVLVAAYTGPFGAFLYVLGCREPLPGLHARYVEARWRQVLGSTMHCVAGDGIEILTGAVIGSLLRVPAPLHITLEYILGFGFGWTIFQALSMRDMAGGSFSRASGTNKCSVLIEHTQCSPLKIGVPFTRAAVIYFEG